MKIVILTSLNFAPPAWQLAQAMRRKGHTVTVIKDHNGERGECDIVLSELIDNCGPVSIHTRIRNKGMRNGLTRTAIKPAQKAVNEADVIIQKDDNPPYPEWNLLFIPEDKILVSLVGGARFRKHASKNMGEFKKHAHYRCAITPDLNSPEYDGYYMQACIDSRKQKNTWIPRKVPLILHTPSNRKVKGTDVIFLPAMKILKEKGYEFEYEILEGVSRESVITAKKKATIFFDQALSGFYGMSALEAMQFGIPTLCYISSEAMVRSDKKITTSKCPVRMTGNTVESVVKTFEKMLRNPEKVSDISKKTKEFTDKFHSYEAVAEEWEKLFKKPARRYNKTGVPGQAPARRGNKKGIIADLKKLKDVFDSCGVKFVMQEGNVLGYARYKDIMEWDLDIDIGVYYEISDEKKAELLRALNIEGCGVGENESGDFIYGRRNVKLNLWFWHLEGEYFVARPKTTDKIFILAAEYFLQPKEIDFLGSKFLIPDPLDGYLDLRYGKGWKHTIITDDAKWKEVEKKIKEKQKLMPWHEFPEGWKV